MANTANYNWPLPSPSGIQINEVAKIATSLIAIDAKLKLTETALSTHKHSFADLLDRPTTLGGYGITDGMTATEVAAAIQQAVSDLVNGSGAALDTLKELADALDNDPQFATTVSNALALRIRVDAAQSFNLAQKTQGRSNLDALGTVDKGKADGVASLDSTGKVPAGQLPALTTTATVGAAIAGANAKVTPDDGDFFTGVAAGGGTTMFKSTWGNIKAALQSLFDGRYLRIIGGTLTGPLALLYPRSNAAVGARNYTPAYIGRIGDTNIEVTLFGEERVGTDVRAVISARSGSVINYAAFTHLGDLEVSRTVHCSDVRASGWLYSGTATFRTDGNIYGSKWNDRFGNWDAAEGIYARIEARGFDRTRDYLLSEQVPIGGYAFLRYNGTVTNLQNVGGGDLTWTNVDTGVGGNGGVINYGTWIPAGMHTPNGGTSTAASRQSLFKRIG